MNLPLRSRGKSFGDITEAGTAGAADVVDSYVDEEGLVTCVYAEAYTETGAVAPLCTSSAAGPYMLLQAYASDMTRAHTIFYI